MPSKCPTTGYSPNSNVCSCEFCLAGRAEWQRKYRVKNPNIVRRMNLRKYGLTIEDFESKLLEQDSVCAVCRQPELHDNQHGKMSLSVDHDHNTGNVRGLLCSQCNRALGLLNDDPNIIEKLLIYRRKYA